MCEYQTIKTVYKYGWCSIESKPIPMCVDNTLCIFCVLGNCNKYNDLKKKGIKPNAINK